ncbi:PAS domain-containing protein [Methylobacterium oryzisoli]|uniref:PAS domain-containing protein n=1 Tax=Methylobacterium oryzisoli TaxID=3385502 RepID=UPI00389169E6
MPNLRLPHANLAEYLRLIDGLDMVGLWRWSFVTNEQHWSQGLYHLLGLDARAVKPDFALLLSLLHPEDRLPLPEFRQSLLDGLLIDRRVRLIRPDGTLRVVRSRAEVFVDPMGRPLRAAGALIDVSNEEALAKARRAEQRQRQALFEQAQVFTVWIDRVPTVEWAPEYLALTGCTNEELVDDWTRSVAPEDRPALHDWLWTHFDTHKPGSFGMTVLLADGTARRFTHVNVPLRRSDGSIEGWAAANFPQGVAPPRPTGRLREGLEQGIEPRHLRAARALLSWTLEDLARASGLSLSTVRRLEEDPEGGRRSRPLVLAALRAAGITFTLVEGNRIAVALTE